MTRKISTSKENEQRFSFLPDGNILEFGKHNLEKEFANLARANRLFPSGGMLINFVSFWIAILAVGDKFPGYFGFTGRDIRLIIIILGLVSSVFLLKGILIFLARFLIFPWRKHRSICNWYIKFEHDPEKRVHMLIDSLRQKDK